MNEVVLVAGMALVTLLVRYPMLALLGRIPRPEPVLRALQYVPVAVLTAIVVPLVLFPEGQPDLRPSNAYLVAAVVTGLLAWRRKNLLLTILVGMGSLLAWRALLALLGLSG